MTRISRAPNVTKAEMDSRFRKEFKGWLFSASRFTDAPDFSYFTCLDRSMFRAHIARQWTSDQNWGNYGTKWHVDHIVPISVFDSFSEEEMKLCWHYLNLRPLDAIRNHAKQDSLWAGMMAIEKRLNVLPQNETLYALRSKVMSNLVTCPDVDLDFLRGIDNSSKEYITEDGFYAKRKSCKPFLITE